MWTLTGEQSESSYPTNEIKSSDKGIYIREILPGLPLEIWEIVFLSMSMTDRLECSELILEFRDFYRRLYANYEKYVDSFKNPKVEKASHHGINSYKIGPYGESYLFNIPQHYRTVSISFSIFLEDSWVGWLNDTNNTFKHVTYEDDGTNNKYLTYLRVNAMSWLRFRVQNLKLPSGRFNLFYKMKGPCSDLQTSFMISVKHKLTQEDTVGYLNLRELRNLGSKWEFLPVYSDTRFTELMEINCCFEKRDEISVELFSLNEYWTRDLSFHVIKFVAVEDHEYEL